MRFYVLGNPKSGQTDAITDFLPIDDSTRGPAPQCRVCGGFIGMLQSLPPRRFELELWGKRFGDLCFGTSNEVMVSERFRDAYLSSGLTGFSEFVPAEIARIIARRGRYPKPVPRYFVTSPARSRAVVDDRASGIDYNKPWTCEECRIGGMMRLRRLVLEPGTWSGEDVFIARGLPGRTIASERFKKFCDQHAFSNCVLIEAEHFHFDHFPGKAPPDLAARPPERK